MKIAEKATLRDYIESVDAICENFENAREFYKNISLVPDFSLQSIAFNKDMEFLKEVSQILSVIVSIIAHPHLSNKREDIIIRVEQASQVQQDAFIRVMQDSSLWKSHKGEMKPEHVYYYQYVDELRIYENQFIALLVDLLDKELIRYNSFYLHKLPVVTDGVNVDFAPIQTSLSQEECAIAVKKTEELRRKIAFVKNTYFYKVVSAGKPISPVIKPTNILLKDRLYCKCFKFYRRFVRYESEYTLNEDVAKYTSFIILKDLDSLGFNLLSIKEGEMQTAIGNKKLSTSSKESDEGDENAVKRSIAPFFNGATFSFEKNGFQLDFQYVPEKQCVKMEVFYKDMPENKICHALCFDGDESGFNLPEKEIYSSVDIFSIWNSFAWENGDKRLLSGDFNEKEMIRRWIMSKITVISGNKEVYSKYCPVCKVKGVEADDEKGVCAFCHAEYLFIGGDTGDKIWLTKIRRS